MTSQTHCFVYKENEGEKKSLVIDITIFFLIEECNFKPFLSNISGNFNIKVTMNMELDRKLFLGQER